MHSYTSTTVGTITTTIIKIVVQVAASAEYRTYLPYAHMCHAAHRAVGQSLSARRCHEPYPHLLSSPQSSRYGVHILPRLGRRFLPAAARKLASLSRGLGHAASRRVQS